MKLSNQNTFQVHSGWNPQTHNMTTSLIEWVVHMIVSLVETRGKGSDHVCTQTGSTFSKLRVFTNLSRNYSVCLIKKKY